MLAAAASKSAERAAAKEQSFQAAAYLLDQIIDSGWRVVGLYSLVSIILAALFFWPMSKLLVGKNGNWKKMLIYFGQKIMLSAIYMAIAFISIRAGWISNFALLSVAMIIASVRLLKSE